MKIAVIGTGYVGLVTGACLADLGNIVTCIDVDASKIARLNALDIPIFEKGLPEIITRNHAAGRLSFVTEYGAAIAQADIVFLAVGTPAMPNGQSNLSFLEAACAQLAPHLQDYTVVVTKSTVPVGTGQKIKTILSKTCAPDSFDVVSNPEFLRQGFAVEDFMHPSRIVVGAETERAQAVMADLYRIFTEQGFPILATSLETSEMIKHTANAFLATKVMFINEIADLCEKTGADIQDVAQAIGLDTRIGPDYLNVGPCLGGSCLPKDIAALSFTGQTYNVPMRILEAVRDSNQRRLKTLPQRIVNACGGDLTGKTVAIWGLTFKAGTDDLRDAPSLTVIPALRDMGCTLRAYDPEGMENARRIYPDLIYCDTALDAARDADIVVVLTEWDVFAQVDLDALRDNLSASLIVDFRNIFDLETMTEYGFEYTSLGRPATHFESADARKTA